MDTTVGNSRRNSAESFVCALGFPLSMVLLAVLEATHVPDPIMVADNARVAMVGGCVSVAAMFTTLSAVLAALPVSRGNPWPLTWLSSLAIAWLAFIWLYDWGSLAG